MKSIREIPESQRNIVLIGFMGVGKTTIGQLVAQKLNRDFVDVDQEIEKNHNMTIPEMFQQKGEAFFRQAEKEYIVDLCEHTERKIVSLGGGAFKQEEIKRSCLKHCTVLYLDVSWDKWKERLDMLIEHRPVLHNRTMDEIKELFEERRDMYADHHVRVDTDDLAPEKVADHIVATLKLGEDVSTS
ncbi:shikimate kinase [Bacillus sp. 179-C3.3 HS]|uniref:shikimate kinase n=1 Tax=Bacillus sp. 179-C3.3 HS TaxID=3232162 RepID=UPI0039A2801C